MTRSVDRGLNDCLEHLRGEGDRRLSARELADIIGEVAQTLIAGSNPSDGPVRTSEQDGHRKAAPAAGANADPDAARAVLAGLVCGGAATGQLAALQRELDEIRSAMQDAAATFLSAAETVENIAGHPDMDHGDQAELFRRATAIYEASAFQDITGQRLTRAAEMLRQLEWSVVSAQAALGDESAAEAAGPLSDLVEQTETRKMERILHGPQSAGTANTQEEIDKILASFD
ncbi:MAG: hypothetical protein GEU87_07415 [Alphaproteobacteria bacterium]|nr:hypothetical protein [Alphaproteobacteria bacterium]